MRLPSESDRQKLLNTAFDAGITHFDAARMYGLGQVERVVGAFAKSRRSDITITSKYGIQLNAVASKLGGMQSIFRRILNLSPALRNIVRSRSKALYKEQTFTIADAKLSLNTSLQSLAPIISIYTCYMNARLAASRRGTMFTRFLRTP